MKTSKGYRIDNTGEVYKDWGSELVPLDDTIVVRPEKAKDKSDGGILLPDRAKNKPLRGTVVACGPGRWQENGIQRVPMGVVAGDTVMYTAYSGAEIEHGDETLLVMREADILSLVK